MFTAATTSLTPKREPEVNIDIFDVFNALTAATSLASKHKPEVGPFDDFDVFATTTTSLVSKYEPEVDFSETSTRFPPLPPPLGPNASRRRFFDFFDGPATTPPPSHSNASQRWFVSTCVQPHHLPRIQTRAGCGFSLVISASLPLPPPPSHLDTSWRWMFWAF